MPQIPGIDLEAMMRQAEQLSASFRQQGATQVSITDLTQFAHNAQAQGLAQMQNVQQAQQSGGGIGAILSAIGMSWSSDYVKRVDCPSCGGPKQLPSPSAYVYCDYCSALADYDFRRACEDSVSAAPGPEYAQLVNSAHADLAAALAAGDQARYRSIQQYIFNAYVSACPKACSHRVNDPAYRTQLVQFMAESSVVTDFDPTYAALMNEMKASVVGMQWTGGFMDRKTGGPTFRAVVDVCQRQMDRGNQLLAAANLINLDPDHASQGVRERMGHSLFAQGWLPMLGPDDAAWLVNELKLGGEYTKIQPPPDGQNRHCGHCGGDLIALPGARAVICNHCGHSIDVGGAQVSCGGCGGFLSFPVGVNRMPCPYCKVETERVGLT